jgi:cation transport ATPase
MLREGDRMPYCHKCGAEVGEDAQFCPSCGTSLKESGETRYGGRRRRDREEKQEKDEKREKGEKGEKQEKGEGSRMSPIVGGLVLIWLGITFYLASTGIVAWANWLGYFLMGLGVIILVQAAAIFSSAKGRKDSAYGSLIGGAILIVIGVSSVIGITYWWAIILIVVGVWIIVSAFRQRARNPRP